MQTEAPGTKSLIKLNGLADEIRSKATEASHFAGEAKRNAGSAVIAAVECGKLLRQAKAICKKSWPKWVQDNCGIERTTAWRYMQLVSHVQQIEGATSLRQAYIKAGILPEPFKKEKVVGTAEVDIFVEFVRGVVSEVAKVERMTARVDLSSMPAERKDEIRSAIGRIKAIEERL